MISAPLRGRICATGLTGGTGNRGTSGSRIRSVTGCSGNFPLPAETVPAIPAGSSPPHSRNGSARHAPGTGQNINLPAAERRLCRKMTRCGGQDFWRSPVWTVPAKAMPLSDWRCRSTVKFWKNFLPTASPRSPLPRLMPIPDALPPAPSGGWGLWCLLRSTVRCRRKCAVRR